MGSITSRDKWPPETSKSTHATWVWKIVTDSSTNRAIRKLVAVEKMK